MVLVKCDNEQCDTGQKRLFYIIPKITFNKVECMTYLSQPFSSSHFQMVDLPSLAVVDIFHI